MTATAQHFTAAQIADAICKSARAVRRALASIPPSGEIVVRGNLTTAWGVEMLPTPMQQQLKTLAASRGFRSVADLLKDADAWQPEFPWNEISSEHQVEAVKLQRALLPILERQRSPILQNCELVEIGQRSYILEFGKDISADNWRYLFNRTLERDRGAAQFHRIELFLPGNLKRAASAQKTSADAEFESLSVCIASFKDALNPTITETDALWQTAIELFIEEAGDKPLKFKRRLLGFLWYRASFLAKSKEALRVNFDRKVKRCKESPDGLLALLDARHLKQGETRADAIPQDDVDIIAWHSARNCGGRTTQAARELGQHGQRSGLTQQTLNLINAPHSSKSHVNRRLFNTVHRDVQLIAPYLLGKKAVDDATASLRRDYSNLASMSLVTADDFTMPVYCFVPDGKGWWTLTRGQVLLMIDVRSLKIIGWSLQPERNYNSLVIRTLMNRVCSTWGLPHAWLFERGIWKQSFVVKGAPREWSEGKSDAELKPGWERLGVKFIHAKRARSKHAELVGGMLQNLMERVPGYCGRDERRDCPELTAKNKLAVESKRAEPHGIFLSFDAWESELGKLIETYNGNKQTGEMLGGMSPDEAFEAHWPHNDPPMLLDATCWHLLAHYVSERQVTEEGIKFRIGNETYIYRNSESSPLRLRKVLAWFDPECPDYLAITDLKERNPVLLPRERKVDVLASQDRDGIKGRIYQEELEKVAGHNSYPKARFHVLKSKFEGTFRKNLVSPLVSDVAASLTNQRQEVQAEQKQTARRRSKAAAMARELGLPATLVNKDNPEAVAGLEMMQRAMRQMNEEEESQAAKPAQPAQASVKKTYILKPFNPGGKSK
jgi:hypothetical protein